MNKLAIAVIFMSSALCFTACERKSPVLGAGCGTSVAKYLKDGSSAKYQILYSTTDVKDSAVIISYTQMLTNVFQKKTTTIKKYVSLPTANFPTTNIIPFYAYLCNKNVYVSELASGIEKTPNAENVYIKGDRKKGDTWTHTLNGVKYYMGLAKRDSAFITPVDTFHADRIYIKSIQNIAVADTIFYNDTVGVLAFKGVNLGYIMVSKNY